MPSFHAFPKKPCRIYRESGLYSEDMWLLGICKLGVDMVRFIFSKTLLAAVAEEGVRGSPERSEREVFIHSFTKYLLFQ